MQTYLYFSINERYPFFIFFNFIKKTEQRYKSFNTLKKILQSIPSNNNPNRAKILVRADFIVVHYQISLHSANFNEIIK